MNTLALLLSVPALLLLTMWLYERRDKEQGKRVVRLRRVTYGPAASVAEVRFRAAMTRR